MLGSSRFVAPIAFPSVSARRTSLYPQPRAQTEGPSVTSAPVTTRDKSKKRGSKERAPGITGWF